MWPGLRQRAPGVTRHLVVRKNKKITLESSQQIAAAK
jgi:hypothetical protein